MECWLRFKKGKLIDGCLPKEIAEKMNDSITIKFLLKEDVSKLVKDVLIEIDKLIEESRVERSHLIIGFIAGLKAAKKILLEKFKS